MKGKRRRIFKQLLSYLLCISMITPNVSPIISYASEYISNQPRQVDFTLPEALTLEELGIDEDFPENSTEAVNDETGKSSSETTAIEESEEEKETEDSSESSGKANAETDSSKEEPSAPSEEGDLEESQEETVKPEEPAAGTEASKEETIIPSESISGMEESPEETTVPKDNSNKSEEIVKETGKGASNSSESHLATPSNAELREPEGWHEVVIDEPEGTLVRFNDDYRIYQVGEDEYITVFGGYSGLYLNEDGKAEDIDNTLEETMAAYPRASASNAAYRTAGFPAYKNHAGKLEVTIPEKLSSTRGIGMVYGDDRLELIPAEGNFKHPVVADNAVRYNNVFENIDYQYTVVGNSLKEDIILLEKQDRYEFTYKLKIPGLKAVLKDRAIQIYKTDKDDPLFLLTAPFMEDANGERSSNITLTLSGGDGVYTVKARADKKWLDQEERSYPVRIDPTPSVVPPDQFIFVTVSQGKPTTHYQWDDTAYVGYLDGGRGNTRVYIAVNALNNEIFNAAMSGAKDCTQAVFKVTAQTNNSNGDTVFMMSAPERAWDAGSLTWARNPGFNYREDYISRGNAPGIDQTVEFDITAHVKDWTVNASTHFGLVIKADVEPRIENGQMIGQPMAAESLYNRTDAVNGPKLEIRWNGELPPEGGTDINATTLDVCPSVVSTKANQKTGRTVTGLVAHGAAQKKSTVHYTLYKDEVEVKNGTAEALETGVYPDFEAAGLNNEMERYKNSNWQSEGVDLGQLKLDTIYGFEAYAVGQPLDEEGNIDEEADPVTGERTERVKFLLYKIKQDDLVKNIARHYGVNPNTIANDNKLYQNQLTEMDTILFIRDPKVWEPYRKGTLDPYEEFLILCLKAGLDPACVMALEPVNMNTGSFYMSQTDAELPELSGSFDITRSYNSILAEYGMEFGMGWSSPFNEHLTLLPDGRILYHRADGKGMAFEKNGENYRAPAGYDGILEPMDTLDIDTATRSNASRRKDEGDDSEPAEASGLHAIPAGDPQNPVDGREMQPGEEGENGEGEGEDEYDGIPATAGWKLTNTDGSVRVFDSMGFLRYTEDLKGHRTLYVYDDDYNLLQVVTPTEKVFNFTMNEDRQITEIILPDGGTVSYEYDGEMNLTSVTDPEGGIRRYEYDDNHRMTAWYDENGNRITANEYDEDDRVVKQTDALGNTAYLEYQGDCTTVTDNRGNVTKYYYDSQLRTTKVAYPDGTAILKSYGEDGYLASERDELGVETSYTYDENGNVLTVTREDGSQASYTYNGQNLPLTATDFEGNTTVYTYDSLGNLLSVTDGEGNTTSYSYDDLSRVIAMTDGNGGISTFTYDGAVPVSYTDGEGGTYAFTYDEMNRQLTAEDPLGNAETYTYDAKGRRTSETAKDGGTTTYEFDPAGCVVSITDPMGVRTDFTYDQMYNIVSGTDAIGNTLAYEYDENYNKIKETDAKGNTTAYTYDSRDRLIKITDALGNHITYTLDARGNTAGVTDRLGNTAKTGYHKILGVPVSTEDALGAAVYYRYDKNGSLKKVIYPDGSELSYTYDRAGRIVSTTAQNGLVTVMTYDGNGNIVRITDNETRVYTFEYDHNNHLIRSTDPLGGVASYEYDAAGNQVGFTDAENHGAAYEYDAAGRLKEITDALGEVTGTDYDLNGRTLKATDAKGNSDTYHYDEIGQLLASVDAAGNITALDYDSLGNVLKITDALKGETAMEYDALSRTTAVTDALGHEYRYTYDANGNLTEMLMPDGDTVTMAYDGNGQIVSSTDEAGVVTNYTYDPMGRIVKAKDNIGNVMTYEYDISGNLVKQTDTIGREAVYEYDRYNRLISATGTDGAKVQYGYDVLDRLTDVTEADGTVTTYEYDKVGNLIKTTEPGEAVYTYAYDAINRITGKTDPLGAASTFAYDGNSNLTEAVDGNGVDTAYSYDVLNRLIALKDGNGNTTGYEYDELSRLLSVTTPEGNKNEYRYDELGNMTKSKDGNGLITEYQYDVMGNLVKAISPKGAETSYTYDKHDELTGITDAMGHVTAYEVDLNRMVTKMTQKNGGEYKYSYDAVHRLTGITTPLGLERNFTYDKADNIIRDTDSLGRTNTFEYDIMHRMTKAINAKGGVETYSYDIRGNVNAVTNAMGYQNTYAYDLIDQLKESVDPEGKATKFTYDLVGNLTSMTKPGERTISYTYDNNYNVTSLTDPKGYIYRNVYDKDNRQITAIDPLNQTEAVAYDRGNRITALTDKMGLSQEFTYDAHGNVTAAKSTNGLLTHFQYDILDRLTMVTDPMGNETMYDYDVMGNITAMTNAQKNVTKYTYDLEGNMTSLTSPMGRKEQYRYDAGGRMASRLTAKGDTIRYDYDVLNGLAEKTYENGSGAESDHPVFMGYNAMGQRISMEDITGESTYTYDALGRLKTAVNGSGKTVEYVYDEADNLSGILYPDGYSVLYTYDKNDNITKIVDRDGRETFYSYDPLNRLTRVKRADGSTSSYTYNARDQIVEAENLCSCGFLISDYKYMYDDAGLIVSETAKECLFASDQDYGHKGGPNDECAHEKENPWQNQNPEWQTTKRTFKYDNNGQLLECKEDKGMFDKTTYTYEYDSVGNRTMAKRQEAFTYANPDKTTYTYNADNQMAGAVVCEGNLTKRYTYQYDANGNLTRECLRNYAETTYQYDTENRLKAVKDGQKLLMAAAYDGDGNRTFQLNYNPEAVCGYGKNVSGEVFMPENSKNEDGSLTAEGDLFGYICSATGRAYDLTEYVNDTNRQYAEVLTAYTVNSGATESYSYNGRQRLSRNNIWTEARDLVCNETSYYLYDGRGSVTANTWYNGMVTSVYQYDPYGQVTLGSTEHADFYGYNAESYNPNTGLEYLRARYYNADTGRFFQEDAYLGDIGDPLTLNRYAYTKNSPLNYVDPSGNNASAVLEGGLSLAGTVSLLDSPAPGPADAIGLIIAGGTLLIAGGMYIGEQINKANSKKKTEDCQTSDAAITEYRLPSWKKVKVDIGHIKSGHTTGGGRGDNNKDKWPDGMSEAAIIKAIEEAYKNAEKAGPVQHSWQDGVEHARQFFEGIWNNRTVQFWFDYTTNQIDSAWPK